MNGLWPLLLMVVLAALESPAFWICVIVLVAGGIVASAIDRATGVLGSRLELIAEKLRKDPADEEDEEDEFDDDL